MAPLAERDANLQTATPEGKKTATGKKRKSNATEGNVGANEGVTQKKTKTTTTTTTKTAPKSKKSARQERDERMDVSEIHLDGEDKDEVPVFDTCNDIRSKINKLIRDGTSNAAFIRELQKLCDGVPPQDLSTIGLKTFLKHSGPTAGASSPIFYASYLFFEKLRVKEGKAKSKKRQEMEEHWGVRGMECSDSTKPMFMHKSERIEVDKYGKTNVFRM